MRKATMKRLALLLPMLVTLTACSRGPEAPPTAPAGASAIPSQTELDTLVAEGIEPLVRRLAASDYYLHYHLMQDTGITDALGGEEQAITVLKAIGEEYERRMQWAKVETPKMIPAAFTGEGMSAGMYGFSAGAAGGFISSSFLNQMFNSGLSDDQFDRMVKEMDENGPVQLRDKNGSIELQVGEDGRYDQTVEYDVEEEGVEGKLKVKIHIDGCPDPQGKMTITFDIDSQMRVAGKAGTGGYIRAQYTKDAWLDDDAQLINTSEGREERVHVEMGGFENYSGQHYEFTDSRTRGGKANFTEKSAKGFSIFRPSEIERLKGNVSQIVKALNATTELMLRGLKSPPWESGRCVKLELTTDPEKKTGADPGTNYRIEARPRAKSDGLPTKGTVRATLAGDYSLDPAGTKVDSDTTFSYANPKVEDKTASIAFESRSKRGVGKASLVFDTKDRNSYRIDAIGDCTGPWDVCDVTKPFSFAVCGGKMSHTPSGDRGGSYTFNHSGVPGNGSYSLSGDEQLLSATYQGQVCPPGMACIKTPPGRATWTKIEECDE